MIALVDAARTAPRSAADVISLSGEPVPNVLDQQDAALVTLTKLDYRMSNLLIDVQTLTCWWLLSYPEDRGYQMGTLKRFWQDGTVQILQQGMAQGSRQSIDAAYQKLFSAYQEQGIFGFLNRLAAP